MPQTAAYHTIKSNVPNEMSMYLVAMQKNTLSLKSKCPIVWEPRRMREHTTAVQCTCRIGPSHLIGGVHVFLI